MFCSIIYNDSDNDKYKILGYAHNFSFINIRCQRIPNL